MSGPPVNLLRSALSMLRAKPSRPYMVTRRTYTLDPWMVREFASCVSRPVQCLRVPDRRDSISGVYEPRSLSLRVVGAGVIVLLPEIVEDGAGVNGVLVGPVGWNF